MADPTISTASAPDPVITAAKAVEASVIAKVVAFAKAHATTAIGVASGYAASHFHIIGAVLKLI